MQPCVANSKQLSIIQSVKYIKRRLHSAVLCSKKFTAPTSHIYFTNQFLLTEFGAKNPLNLAPGQRESPTDVLGIDRDVYTALA